MGVWTPAGSERTFIGQFQHGIKQGEFYVKSTGAQTAITHFVNDVPMETERTIEETSKKSVGAIGTLYKLEHKEAE
jgi:hypothetical protein